MRSRAFVQTVGDAVKTTAYAATACAALAFGHAGAQEIRGLVVDIPAGDRLVVRTIGARINVKLAGISAPAFNEPLHDESRRSLMDLCYGKAATVMPTGTTLDGDTLAEVSCGGVRSDESQLRKGWRASRRT